MVLDSKHMEWASRQGLETATLKKAKVPIFGKWYFPDLPAQTSLINLSTGEIETFPAGFRAGAVLYVKEADLKEAGLGPYKPAAPPAAPANAPEPELAAVGATAATATATTAPSRPALADRPTLEPRPAAAHAAAPTLHPAPSAHAPAHGGPSSDLHAGDEHAHPGPKTYVIVALILCIITAIEVWIYYIPALLPYIFPILLVLSVVKFVIVVGWFMHLKFDHTSFTWYFGGGLMLAVSMVLALIALQIATHGPPPGDGNAHTFPRSLAPASAPAAPKPGGH